MMSEIFSKKKLDNEGEDNQQNGEFTQVENVIEKDIRPFIEADGGSIRLIEVKDGIVTVSLAGACAGCPGAVMTLKGGVEKILKMRIENIKEVRLAY